MTDIIMKHSHEHMNNHNEMGNADELDETMYEMTHGNGFMFPLIISIIVNVVFITGFVCIIVFA